MYEMTKSTIQLDSCDKKSIIKLLERRCDT